MAITNYKISLDRSSQQEISRIAWDRLPTRHKNILKGTLDVQTYNRKGEPKLLNSQLNIEQENPTFLLITTPSQRSEPESIDLVRLFKKKGIIWNEEALMYIKSDKKISNSIKAKLRSDVIMFLKEDDALEIFIVFQTKEDMNEWAAALKSLVSQFSDHDSKKTTPKIQSSHSPVEHSSRQNGRAPKRPYMSTMKSIIRVKPEMILKEITFEENQKDTSLFMLDLWTSNNREVSRVFTIEIQNSKYFSDPAAHIERIMNDISPLAYLDKEIIRECIKNTMLNVTFREKSRKIYNILDQTYNQPNGEPHPSSLAKIALQLKSIKDETKENKKTDMYTKLFNNMTNVKLQCIVENYETLAKLQEVKGSSFISNTPNPEDSEKQFRFNTIPQKDAFLSRDRKGGCDCSTVCKIF